MAQDPSIGRVIGKCRLVEKIGEGELGVVYKAEDPVHGVVALQIVPPERLASPVILEAFGDAVKLASQLHHPRAVRVYGMENTPEGGAAVLMELFSGMSLRSFQKGHPGLDIPEACRLVREASDGVLAAHRLSMVHGALHPERIFVVQDGTVKVGGFHRSGVREGVDVYSVTPDNLVYLAPEQIGIVRDLPAPDYRADVYALGVILYELLAARLPYESKTVQELAAIMESSPPLPPNFANPHVSPLLSRMVLRALAKHPSERPGSMEEFIRELDAVRQPTREPQPRVVQPSAGYEPQYPPPAPPGRDGGLFSRPAEPAQDSSLFGPSQRDQAPKSPDNIWPEAAREKDGEGSFFGWFKTRYDRSGGGSRPSQSRSSGPAWDDQSSAGSSAGRASDGEFTEHTVVVSGRKGGKRKSFSDSGTNFSWRGGDQDATGTGTLPRRHYARKGWLIAGGITLLVLAALVAAYILIFTEPTGKLLVLTNPPGAQVSTCLEPCQDGNFRPLSGPELKAGMYRVRVQLEGYEPQERQVEVTDRSELPQYFELTSKLPPPPMEPPPTDSQQTGLPPQPHQLPPEPPQQPKLALAVPFNQALQGRNFFDAPGNAWDILQRWQQGEAGTPSAALEDSWRRFCRALEEVGQEKLQVSDFAGARQLLDQARSRMPGSSCAAGLQAGYEKAISNNKQNLMISAQSAMDRQSYVTPEAENALKYVRLIEHIDPQDADAKRLEGEIFTRAWEQAQGAATKRQHQEALEIYNQLKAKYPNPPVGVPVLNEAIQKQTQKLEQYQALKASYAAQVKHGHPRGMAFWRTKECSGSIRVDGFAIEFKSVSEPEHSFRIGYDALREVKLSGNSLIINHPGIRPEGKIELEEIDKKAPTSIAQLYKRIQDYRVAYAEYMK